MDNTLKERLIKIATSNNLTIAAFERNCGLSNGYIRNVSDTISSKSIMGILRVFPNINPLWLISGIGNMYADSENSNCQTQQFSNNSKSFNNFSYDLSAENQILKAELEKRDEQIDRMIKLLEYIVYQHGNFDFPALEILPESRQK